MILHGDGERGPVTIGMLICLLSVVFPSLLQAQPVLEVLENNRETTEFAKAVRSAGLDARLNTDGPYTIFAPDNDALQRVADRLNRNNGSALRKFLLNHILTGMATKRQITAMSKAPSLGGLTLRIQEDNHGNVKVNTVSVSRYNIRAKNGIIHVIDGVLE